MKKIIILITSFFFLGNCFAFKLKVRAREQYEVNKIKFGNNKVTSKGFSNTINVWLERPYDISYGLSFSPVLSNLENDSNSTLFGEKLKVHRIGFELKWFFQKILYLRPGVHFVNLKPRGTLGDKSGYDLYLGLGMEYPFDMFGLAFEVGASHADLKDDTSITTIMPSIGFHFYKKF